jgi:hypothetical protein
MPHIIAYDKDKDLIVEGIRDADGTFRVLALYRKAEAPPVEAGDVGDEVVLLTGAGAREAIEFVERWLLRGRAN